MRAGGSEYRFCTPTREGDLTILGLGAKLSDSDVAACCLQVSVLS